MILDHQHKEEVQLPLSLTKKNLHVSAVPSSNHASIESMSSRADHKPTMRILAIGDSLTEGLLHQSDFDKFRPYTIVLEEKLRQDYGCCFEFEVHNRGISGICASDLLEYLHYVYPDIFNQSWDVILALVGTNDVGIRRKPEKITSDLKAIYESLAELPSAPTLTVMSIPNCCATEQWIDDNRKQVNTWIEAYVSKGTVGTNLMRRNKAKLFFLDLHKHIPYKRGDAKWSEDGLHLSALGYDEMGAYIYDILDDVVAQTVALRVSSAQNQSVHPCRWRLQQLLAQALKGEKLVVDESLQSLEDRISKLDTERQKKVQELVRRQSR